MNRHKIWVEDGRVYGAKERLRNQSWCILQRHTPMNTTKTIHAGYAAYQVIHCNYRGRHSTSHASPRILHWITLKFDGPTTHSTRPTTRATCHVPHATCHMPRAIRYIQYIHPCFIRHHLPPRPTRSEILCASESWTDDMWRRQPSCGTRAERSVSSCLLVSHIRDFHCQREGPSRPSMDPNKQDSGFRVLEDRVVRR